jgi:YVTN family beta-propeller protein
VIVFVAGSTRSTPSLTDFTRKSTLPSAAAASDTTIMSPMARVTTRFVAGSIRATPGPPQPPAIDPLTGTQHAAEYTPANDPAAITYADGALWVANFDANTVTELNPLDRMVKRTATVAAAPVAITAYAGSIWVVGSKQETVSRIAIAAGTGSPVVTTIHVGHRPSAIASGSGAVWVANQGDRTVSRIDPETNRVTATIHIGAEPSGLVVGSGMVWVSAQPVL